MREGYCCPPPASDPYPFAGWRAGPGSGGQSLPVASTAWRRTACITVPSTGIAVSHSLHAITLACHASLSTCVVIAPHFGHSAISSASARWVSKSREKAGRFMPTIIARGVRRRYQLYVAGP